MFNLESLPQLHQELQDKLLTNPFRRAGGQRIDTNGLMKLLRSFHATIPEERSYGWSLNVFRSMLQEHSLLVPKKMVSQPLELQSLLFLREIIEHIHEAKPPELGDKDKLNQDAHLLKIMRSCYEAGCQELSPASLVGDLVDLGFRHWKVAVHMFGIEGISVRVAQLKSQLWEACFGSQLRHALEFKNVLMERNVLILGPTGTGKELAAMVYLASLPGMINERGGFSYQPPPVQTVNLAVYPPDLVGSQLMGYKKGAFTGAINDFDGLLRRAHGGGAFLDEVGDLPSDTQVKLLRALETKKVQPIGGDKDLDAVCRIVCATHVDLDVMLDNGSFREDLYYRLAGKVIQIPSLSARKEDLERLAARFLRDWEVSAEVEMRVKSWCRTQAVQEYDWPGNIREFRKAVSSVTLGEDWSPQRVMQPTSSTVRSVIQPESPPAQKESGHELTIPPQIYESKVSLAQAMSWYTKQALQANNDNISTTAKVLQISRARVRRILEEEPEWATELPSNDNTLKGKTS